MRFDLFFFSLVVVTAFYFLGVHRLEQPLLPASFLRFENREFADSPLVPPEIDLHPSEAFSIQSLFEATDSVPQTGNESVETVRTPSNHSSAYSVLNFL